MKIKLSQGMLRNSALVNAGISGSSFGKGKPSVSHKNKKHQHDLGQRKHKSKNFEYQ